MDFSTPSHIWASYLRWMLASLAALLTTVGSLNVFIDPLAIFGSPRVEGLNARKPYLDHHRELARWYAARRLCADTAIFGNSRAEIGFNPENPAFTAHGMSAFNHAIPGSAVTLALQQLNWLKDCGCAPKTTIIGVEFFDFLSAGKPGPGLSKNTPPAPQMDERVIAETVFSITGLRDSLKTIALQDSRYPALLTERGFNPLDNYIPEVENSGHYVLFRQRAEENRRIWSNKGRHLRAEDGSDSIDQQALKAFLTRATTNGGKVNIVIYPYHAQIRMMLERMGMGGLFSDWKKLIVSVAAQHTGVDVWDFSGISPETLEAIPTPGDRKTHLRHYWEAGHFKSALGDKVIARMLGEDGNFGIKIQLDNVDAWAERDRAAVQTLLSRPSALLTEVDDVLKPAK